MIQPLTFKDYLIHYIDSNLTKPPSIEAWEKFTEDEKTILKKLKNLQKRLNYNK